MFALRQRGGRRNVVEDLVVRFCRIVLTAFCLLVAAPLLLLLLLLLGLRCCFLLHLHVFGFCAICAAASLAVSLLVGGGVGVAVEQAGKRVVEKLHNDGFFGDVQRVARLAVRDDVARNVEFLQSFMHKANVVGFAFAIGYAQWGAVV